MDYPGRLLEELKKKTTSGNLTFLTAILVSLLLLLALLWRFFSDVLALAADLQAVTGSPSGNLILVIVLAASLFGTIAVIMGWWIFRVERKNKSLREEVSALKRCIDDIEGAMFKCMPGDISRHAKLCGLVEELRQRDQHFQVKEVMELGDKHYLILDAQERHQIQVGMHFTVFGETGGVCGGQVEDVSLEGAKLRLYGHKKRENDEKKPKKSAKEYWGNIRDTARPINDYTELEEEYVGKQKDNILLHLVVDLVSEIERIVKRCRSKYDNATD